MSYVVVQTKDDLLAEAAKHAPLVYRILNLSLSMSRLEARLHGLSEWEEWKRTRQQGDRIWPFIFNRDTLAMRRGYVIMRGGAPHEVILTEVS